MSYGAAKAAQESYTLAAATELADQGITANVVYPPSQEPPLASMPVEYLTPTI